MIKMRIHLWIQWVLLQVRLLSLKVFDQYLKEKIKFGAKKVKNSTANHIDLPKARIERECLGSTALDLKSEKDKIEQDELKDKFERLLLNYPIKLLDICEINEKIEKKDKMIFKYDKKISQIKHEVKIFI